MSEPWISSEVLEAGDQCGFRAGDDGQGVRCPARAILHVLSESAVDGLVALCACAGHASLARTAGLYQGEHPFGDGCTPQATTWYDDACRPA